MHRPPPCALLALAALVALSTCRLAGPADGTLSVSDLRRQAQQTIQAVEQAKKDMPELDDALDGYLSILREFIKDSAPAH